MGWLKKAAKEVSHVGHHISNGLDWFQEEVLGSANKSVGWNKPGDGPNMDISVGTSTPIIDEKTQQAINTTAYMENGGYDMLGSNTAYNEEQNNGSWWDRNQDWIIPTLTTIGTTAAGMIYNNHQQNKANNFNAEEAAKNRQFNEEQAKINREYETEMSNTAHQREYADLLATGLNPVNTATGGSGASSPAGSAASGSPATSTNPAYMDNSIASTALSIAESLKTLNESKWISKEKKAQIANVGADTLLKNAETTGAKAKTDETKANTEKIKAETENIKEQFNLLSIQEQQMVMDYATAYANAQNERQKAEIETKFYNTGFGKAMKYTGLTLSSLLPILGPIGRFATPQKSGGLTVNNVNY